MLDFSPEHNIERYAKSGFPEHSAELLTWLEGSAQGAEERMGDDVEKVTERPRMQFDDWVWVRCGRWSKMLPVVTRTTRLHQDDTPITDPGATAAPCQDRV